MNIAPIFATFKAILYHFFPYHSFVKYIRYRIDAANAKAIGTRYVVQLLPSELSSEELPPHGLGPLSTFPFLSSSLSSPIKYALIISLASVECPTSSNDSVASLLACSTRISSPPGCSSKNFVTSYTLSWMTIHIDLDLSSLLDL